MKLGVAEASRAENFCKKEQIPNGAAFIGSDVARKKMSESGSLGTSSTSSDVATDPFSQLLASVARPIPSSLTGEFFKKN
ncbi:unnamed protein product [Gongylonema pulchrum]|uniref:Coatomer subunit delta n=1 Tax=Gongylonema pulchrum TaxID=637853 RepID=A0A183E8G9_9BILA|nr:unnamed protein product [Gongylonema pulchrum]